MGDADHEVALLLLAEDVDILLGGLSGIDIGDSLAVAVEDKALQLWSQGKDTDLDAIALQGDIRLDEPFEHSSRAVVVGTHDGEVCHTEEFGHIVHAEVELMVADGNGIIVHLVHQADLDLSLEKGIVARTLREVTAVDEQQFGMLLALFLDHINTTQESATACKILIVEVHIERHDGGMSIIGVQNDELLLLLGGSCQHRQQCYYYNKV